MMMVPRRRNEFDVFHDMFRDPFFDGHEERMMRTDIKEKGDKYLIDIDLPGFEKENIQIEIEDGYLNIHASTDTKNEDKDGDNYVRRERFIGECSRSFYVGDDIKEEDIKATFKNGTLKIEVPKREEKEEVPEKKYIQIDD